MKFCMIRVLKYFKVVKEAHNTQLASLALSLYKKANLRIQSIIFASPQ